MEEPIQSTDNTITIAKPRPKFGDWVELISYPVLGLGTAVFGGLIIVLLLLVPLMFASSSEQILGLLTPAQATSSPGVQAIFLVLFSFIEILMICPVFFIGFSLKKFSWKSFGLDKIKISWKVVLESLIVVVAVNGFEMLIEYLQKIWNFKLPEFNSSSLGILNPTSTNIGMFIVFLITIGIIGPICEEIFFRGAIYGWFRRYYKPWVGILVSSLFFGVLHYETLLRMIFAISIGAYMAWMYERDKTLTSPITLHILNNSIVVALMFFFPNIG
jgi:uncharacterized protein